MAMSVEEQARGAGGGAPRDMVASTAAYGENIRDSRTNLLVLLLAQLYCLITIGATQDAALLSNSTTQTLPILETSISIESFYVLAPLLLMMLFLNFLHHLKGFWTKAIRAMDVVGVDLDDVVETHPWFVTNGLTRRFAGLGFGGLTGLVEYGAALIFAFFSTTIVIFMMWARFLTKHDLAITGYHAAMTAVAFAAGIYFLYASHAAIRNKPLQGLRAAGRATTVTLAFAAPFLALLGASWLLIEAPERDCALSKDPACAYYETLRERLLTLGLDPAAQLDRVDLSTRPSGWTPEKNGEKQQILSVQGVDLKSEDLRYAQAKEALLVRATLTGASIRHGDFEDALLHGAIIDDADLSASSFKNAHFDHAVVKDTRIDGTDFTSASFFHATLQPLAPEPGPDGEIDGPSFKLANFTGVNGVGAQLIDANLQQATLTDANFRLARFERVDLALSRLDGASFERARLAQTVFSKAESDAPADFEKARIDGFDAVETRLPGSNFSNAQIAGLRALRAQLEKTRFAGASLQESRFQRSFLSGANFFHARLAAVRFIETDLQGANFVGAVFDGVEMRDTVLSDAKLHQARFLRSDLSQAMGLTQAQLDVACGDAETKPPAGLRLPRCPADS